MSKPESTTTDRLCRIVRIRDLPVSKSKSTELIRKGLIKSYMPLGPGKTRGPRFVDLDSFEKWVRGETKESVQP
jgi:hypothetical protein